MAKKPAKKAKLKQSAADKKFMARVAKLNLNPIRLNDDFLALFLEMQKGRSIGEINFLHQAAMAAYYQAAEESDNPAEWLKAARKAAKLP